jgi:uncharacterized protein (DUF1501 family)
VTTPFLNTAFTGRRLALKALWGATSLWAAPTLWAQNTPDHDGRLVIVLLRGAYDGLSALVPYADPHYHALRPNIAIAPPDGSDQTTLPLDATFGLHPALAPLLPLWRQGVLSAVPASGSATATRSHFDAQRYLEQGTNGKANGGAGWLNTLAGLPGPASDKATHLVGVGEANPLILAGAQPNKLVPKGQAATREGVLGNERTREAVMALYAGNDPLSQAFRAGAQSRIDTAQTLNAEMNDPAMSGAEMAAANNGAGSAQGLLLDARHLGTLMRQNRALKLGFLSAGGWDTHANQGAATGGLARNLEGLSSALVQLRRDFSGPKDVIVVLSEFGRTTAENGTRGTDHGHGNAMWLLGNAVNGGRWHGGWNGLAASQLNEGRDLPVLNDYRGVLAQVLRATHGLSNPQLAQLFPGFAWDPSLNALMRA